MSSLSQALIGEVLILDNEPCWMDPIIAHLQRDELPSDPKLALEVDNYMKIQ